MKKIYVLLVTLITFGTILIVASCKKNDKVDPSKPVVTLSNDFYTGKSEQDAVITVSISAPNGIKSLNITKGVNLQPDNTFGTNGLMTVAPPTSGATTWDYVFTYKLKGEEANKLVGFNFRVEDAQGKATEKDLTVNTTVSGAQILYSYKWNLKSKFHQSGTPPFNEEISDCESDDYYTFNQDGTMAAGFGSKACTFDGLNVYTGWTLSDDEKTLKITYASLFDPSKITTDTYTVKSLTKDRMAISILLDLTVFGLSDKEEYVYTYDASPR